MISQGIEAKLDGQERNNSIYRLKFPNGSYSSSLDIRKDRVQVIFDDLVK